MNKYFNDIDLSKAETTKVDALIKNTVKTLFSGVQSSTVNFFDKKLESEEDYQSLINNILTEAFTNADDINKCKALFAIYISGLDLNQSNMFGLIKLLITAVRSCGSLIDVDVFNVCRKYTNEISNHKLEPITVGSISKCNFLGKKIDFDVNDTFSQASDNKYNTRILANVRDSDKGQNIGYKLKMNAHRRIEANVKKRINTEPSAKNAIESMINSSPKDEKGNPTMSEQEAIDKMVNIFYKKWLKNSYSVELERYKQNKDKLINKKPRLENFD